MSARAKPWRVLPLPNGKAAGIERKDERTGEAVARPAASAGKAAGMKVPERTDTRSLLSGLIFCADCGSRLTFSHNTTRRKKNDGTVKVYEQDCYRCYRKINARETYGGQSAYNAETINEVVLYEIRRIFSTIREKPETALLSKARENRSSVCNVAYRQAEQEYLEAHKQMAALEDQAINWQCVHIFGGNYSVYISCFYVSIHIN